MNLQHINHYVESGKVADTEGHITSLTLQRQPKDLNHSKSLFHPKYLVAEFLDLLKSDFMGIT